MSVLPVDDVKELFTPFGIDHNKFPISSIIQILWTTHVPYQSFSKRVCRKACTLCKKWTLEFCLGVAPCKVLLITSVTASCLIFINQDVLELEGIDAVSVYQIRQFLKYIRCATFVSPNVEASIDDCMVRLFDLAGFDDSFSSKSPHLTLSISPHLFISPSPHLLSVEIFLWISGCAMLKWTLFLTLLLSSRT